MNTHDEHTEQPYNFDASKSVECLAQNMFSKEQSQSTKSKLIHAIELDTNGVITNVFPGLLKFIGLDQKTMEGYNLDKFVRNVDTIRLNEMWKKVLNNTIVSWELTFRGTTNKTKLRGLFQPRSIDGKEPYKIDLFLTIP